MDFSFHLVETSLPATVRLLRQRWARSQPAGLLHWEPMAARELATPTASVRRFVPGRVALFAAWEIFDDLEAWLVEDAGGRSWAEGWHVRLEFLRRWGHVGVLPGLPEHAGQQDPDEPVVAVTLARLKLPQVARFVRRGRPVVAQVREDPGQVLALAAAAPPRTVSTFTVWRRAQAMTDMVAGRSGSPGAHRHVEAVHERGRADFHHEFTTMRFRCLEEDGSWLDRSNIVPQRRDSPGGSGAGPSAPERPRRQQAIHSGA